MKCVTGPSAGRPARLYAPPDGVSRGAPLSSTSTLIALAAAGRNPTGITLPTVGSQGADPQPGGHEVPAGTKPGSPRIVVMSAAEMLQRNMVPGGTHRPPAIDDGYWTRSGQTATGSFINRPYNMAGGTVSAVYN